ncbi:MAG: hypothetical protein ACYSU0_04960 [Planctomycetota bacterium]|jgi:hypothetical protein
MTARQRLAIARRRFWLLWGLMMGVLFLFFMPIIVLVDTFDLWGGWIGVGGGLGLAAVIALGFVQHRWDVALVCPFCGARLSRVLPSAVWVRPREEVKFLPCCGGALDVDVAGDGSRSDPRTGPDATTAAEGDGRETE